MNKKESPNLEKKSQEPSQEPSQESSQEPSSALKNTNKISHLFFSLVGIIIYIFSIGIIVYFEFKSEASISSINDSVITVSNTFKESNESIKDIFSADNLCQNPDTCDSLVDNYTAKINESYKVAIKALEKSSEQQFEFSKSLAIVKESIIIGATVVCISLQVLSFILVFSNLELKKLILDSKEINNNINELDKKTSKKINEFDKKTGKKIDEIKETTIKKIDEFDKKIIKKINDLNINK